MSVIELEKLLGEISPEAPSGESDLEYDPDFMELEEELEGTPAVEVDNKIVQEAKEPNWSKVRKSSLHLLTRAHDLRVAIALTRALLHLEGLPGFRDGLTLVQGFVEGYWDTLYPQLDPDDRNDPTVRVNLLESLNDWSMTVAPLMKVSLCATRSAGSFNLRHYRIATNKLADLNISEEEKETSPTLTTIEGAFAECDENELRTTMETVGASLQALQAIGTFLEDKIGSALAPDLEQLHQVLAEIHHVLTEQFSRRSEQEGAEPAAESNRPSHRFGAVSEWVSNLRRAITDGPQEAQDSDMPGKGQPHAQPAPQGGGTSAQRIESSKDVLHLLGQICSYYERFEPASPIPLLLQRAMRLVDKSFMEIMKDLAPDGLPQIRTISGTSEEEY